jgi:hypothetical protein
VKSNPDNTIITDEWDFEYCKDYLFETIIEIADNSEAKELINNNHNLFSTNSNFRYNPMFPFRRNTNKLSVEKLDFLYKIGSMIIDRLGEEKVSEILASLEIANPEVYEELNEVIMSNEKLSERIYTLNEMNEDLISIMDFIDKPIICGILFAFLGIVIIFIYAPLNIIIEIFNISSDSLIAKIMLFLMTPLNVLYIIALVLVVFEFGCFPNQYPYSKE